MADPKALAPTEGATTSTDDEQATPSPDRFESSHYAVDREIARGGMGRIVAAEDLEIGRPVAIKELLLRSPGSAARFEREARLTARLQHPAIVPIYEIGRWSDGTPYYAMRMVEGKTLREAIAERATLATRLQLLPALIAAAEAVAFAHSRNVIHRDLSPNNVLVGAYGETVVIDWGLAKVVTDLKTDAETLAEDLDTTFDPKPKRRQTNVDLTVEGSLLGTIAYMPVEQASGEAVDTRADVYTLGALLYHVLSGKPPYQGPEVLEALHAGPPRDLAELVPDAPRDLRSIVAKAMARSADARYRDAGALVDELRRFQTGAVVHAHRYTRRERIRRWVRRRRGLTIGVAAAVIGALAATALVITLGGKDEAPLAGPTCADEAPKLDGVWDEPNRRAIETAFATTKNPFAGLLASRISTAIDDYTQEIRRTSIESCEATRRGVQSREIASNRTACLDDRLEDVRAMVAVLKTPTRVLLENGEGAVLGLERADRCSERAAAVHRVDPAQLAELRRRIAKAKALIAAAEPIDSVIEAERALEAAGHIGSPSKTAEARLTLGAALVGGGRVGEAEPVLRAGLSSALEVKRDDLAAGGAFTLSILAATAGNHREARVYVELGLAIARRLDQPQLLLVGLHASGVVHMTSGDPLRALATTREALPIGEKLYGRDDPMLYTQEFAVGAALVEASAFETAIPHLERAIALREPVAGRDDVTLTATRSVLGSAYAYAGRFDNARRELELALSIRERTRNPLMVASVLDAMADLHRLAGEPEKALPLVERTLGLVQILGKHHEVWAQLATSKARVLIALKRYADAEELFAEIVAAAAPTNPHLAKVDSARAELAVIQRKWREAEVAAERSIAAFERMGGPTHPELWRPLTALAGAKLEQGKPDRALLERATAIAATTEVGDAELAPLRALASRVP